jgi:DNA-binding transcriptional LysR family regulator
MVTSCGVLELPDALAAFHRRHPGVEISLREDNSDQLLEDVRSGHLDLAAVGIAGGAPDEIAIADVIDDRLFAAVHPADPVAGENTITLSALAAQPLVSLPRGTGLRSALDDAFGAAGLRAQIAFEASNLMMVAALAARELGVAILPESVATAEGSALHAIAVAEPEVRSRLALAWRAEGPVSPAARELIAVARAALGRS